MDTNIERFAALYEGRADAYGTYEVKGVSESGKVEGKALTHSKAVKAELFARHLNGEQGLGIVPLRGTEVKRVIGDIDKIPVQQSLLVAARCYALGLPVVVSLSKSDGVHVAAHFHAWTDAARACAAMKRLLDGLGYGGSEIFPKQTRPEDADVGNWINLPMFKAGLSALVTERHILEPLSAEAVTRMADVGKALDFVEARLTTIEELEAALDALHASTRKQMPPCVERMGVKGGVGEGGRNNALYQFAVYFRQLHQLSKGDEVKMIALLADANEKFFDPSSPHDEVVTVAKSALKEKYFYKCTDQPMADLCDKAECLRRKFGIGRGEYVGRATSAPEPWADVSDVMRFHTPLPKVPEDFLPGDYGAVAKDIAYRLQTHVEFGIIGLIFAVATAAGSYCRAQPKRHDTSFRPSARIYGSVVATSGFKKSPALEQAIESIIKVQSAAKARYLVELADYEVKLAEWEATPEDKRGDKPAKPIEEVVIATDSTTEAMNRDITNTPQGFGRLEEELAALVKRFNQYRAGGSGGDMEYILSAASGSFLNVRRKGDGGNYALRTFLTIVGTIQPEVVVEYFMSRDKVANGFAARFSLMLWPDSIERGYVDAAPDRVSADAVNRHVAAVRRAFKPDDPEWDGVTFRFDPAGSQAFGKFSLANEAEGEREGNPLQEHYGKYDGFVAQLALVLHLMSLPLEKDDQGVDVLKLPGVGEDQEITAATVRKAIDFVETVLKAHARKIYGLAAEGKHATGGRRIAQWLIDGRRTSFRRSDTVKNKWRELRETEDLDGALEWLETRDAIRGTGKLRRGQASSWEVNPGLLQVTPCPVTQA